MAIVALVATVVSSFAASAVRTVHPLPFSPRTPVVPPVLANTAKWDDIAAQLANLNEKMDGVASRLEAKMDVVEKKVEKMGGVASRLEAKMDVVEKKVDANFRELEPQIAFVSKWIVSTTCAATCAVFFASRQTAVFDAGRALKANQLLAIAREAVVAFGACFTALFAALTVGFDVHMRRMHRLRQAASKP